MQIEEGKYYRTRDGRKAGPMIGPDYSGTFKDNNIRQKTSSPDAPQWWNGDGSVYGEVVGEENDTLVCEWGDNPQLSTWSDEALSQLLARVETTNAADAAIIRLVMERLS